MDGKAGFAWRLLVGIGEAQKPNKFAAMAYAPTVLRAVADEPPVPRT
jgi:hypothetical protein